MSLFAEYEQDFKGMVASIIKRCGKIPDLDGGTLAEDTLPPCTTSSYYINIIYGITIFRLLFGKTTSLRCIFPNATAYQTVTS